GLGLALARGISSGKEDPAPLARGVEVEALLTGPKKETWCKFQDSPKWLRLTPEEEPGGMAPADGDASAADTSPGAKILVLTWVENKAVAHELQRAESVVIGLPGQDDRRARIGWQSALPATEGKRRVTITSDGTGADLHGWYDPESASILLPVKELPN